MSRARWRIGAIARQPGAVDVDVEAALWLERLAGEPGDALRARFEQWRESDPAHEAALARVEAAGAAALALADAPEILALRHQTLTRIVVAPRRWGLAAAAAVAALLLVPVATGLWPAADAPPAPEAAAAEPSIYRTGVGERLTVALADGSTVVLNTSSRLRVAFTEGERRLVLEAGQALFEVAKDKTRPFIVAAGDRIVTATGTAFDVKLGRQSVEVKLIEGEVTVAPASRKEAAAVMRMKPNEVLVASAGTMAVKSVPDIAQAVSWRDGLVVFENERLADAVAEVNRYTRRPIQLAGAEIGELRVSGAFRTGETDAFVEALELGFGVEVRESGPERVVLAAR